MPLLRTPADFWHELDWEKTKVVKPDSVSAADWKRFEKTAADWAGDEGDGGKHALVRALEAAVMN